MPILLGNNEKLRVMINGVTYRIPISTISEIDQRVIPLTNGNLLVNRDGSPLTDVNGVYITAKKED